MSSARPPGYQPRLSQRAALRQRPRTRLRRDGRVGPANASDWASSRPAKPGRNGYIESFNARVREECLSINILWSLAQARVVIADWKQEYNHHRRHSALGYQTPASYAAVCTHQ